MLQSVVVPHVAVLEWVSTVADNEKKKIEGGESGCLDTQ